MLIAMVYRTIRKLLSFLLLLTSQHKRLKNFILWPLSNKVFPQGYSEKITLLNGMQMVVYQDIHDGVNKSIMFSGSQKNFPWEPGTSSLFSRLVKGKKVILIAGGHLGYFALLAAHLNSDAKIYVFEPIKRMFDRLTININLNHFKNIFAEHKALAHFNGLVEIVSDAGQSSLIHHAGNVSKQIEKIESITIDSYFTTKGESPDLILLDVEGYESFVLNGAQSVLKARPDLILEINHKMLAAVGSSQEKIYGILDELGYDVEKISEGFGEDTERHFNIFATAKKV